MRNKYAGKCYKCGEQVEVGTGHFERHAGVWRTQHALVPGDGRMTCKMVADDVEETVRIMRAT